MTHYLSFMPYFPFNQQLFSMFKQRHLQFGPRVGVLPSCFAQLHPFATIPVFLFCPPSVLISDPLKYQNTHPQHCCFSQKTMLNKQMSESLSSVNTLTHHPVVRVNPVAFKVLYYTQLQYYFQSKTDFKTNGAAVSNDGSIVELLY